MPCRMFNPSELIFLWIHGIFVDFCFFYHDGLDFFLVELIRLVTMSFDYSDSLVLIQPYFWRLQEYFREEILYLKDFIVIRFF